MASRAKLRTAALAPEVGPDEHFVSSDLSIEDPCTLRGFIDQIDASGVGGWAVDLTQTGLPVKLLLAVDDLVVAETLTSLWRPDLSAAIGENARAGFFFGPRQLDRLREFLPVLPQGCVRVVADGTPFCLQAGARQPSLVELFGASLASTGPWQPAFDLLVHLSGLQDAAIELAAFPLRPDPHQEQGFIEALTVDEGDCVWLIGWMNRPLSTMLPAVIVDRQKIPSALAITCYDREDVAASACGFVGLLQTAWRPSTSSKAHVYFGDRPDSHLGTVRPLKLISTSEFSALVSPILARSHTGPVGAIRSLLARPERWALSAGHDWPTTSAAIDNCLVLPGFGALVEGWVLSPVKIVVGLALRIGASILTCDVGHLFWRDRQDLAGSNPMRRALLDRAGFVAAFRGKIEIGHLSSAILKILYEDGSSSNHAVSSASLGRIGHSDDLEIAFAMYPHLASEPFFGEFVAALREEFHAKSRLAVPKHVELCERAIIVALPKQKNDLLLAVSQLAQFAPALTRGVGLVLIASQSNSLPIASSIFGELRKQTTAPCSLFCVQETEHALYALPSVLASVRADRFAFAASSVLLRPDGWTSMMTHLASDGGRIGLFGAHDPASITCSGEFSTRCFAWRRRAFLPWLRERQFYFGDMDDTSGEWQAAAQFGDCAFVLGRTAESRWSRVIDTMGPS